MQVSKSRNCQSGIDYVAKRKTTFERIAKLQPIPVSSESPAASEILRQVREEEAR